MALSARAHSAEHVLRGRPGPVGGRKSTLQTSHSVGRSPGCLQASHLLGSGPRMDGVQVPRSPQLGHSISLASRIIFSLGGTGRVMQHRVFLFWSQLSATRPGYVAISNRAASLRHDLEYILDSGSLHRHIALMESASYPYLPGKLFVRAIPSASQLKRTRNQHYV